MKQLLQDEAVRLRALEPTDVDTLMAWENDTQSWDSSTTIAPFSRAVLWQYLQQDVADIYRQGELRLVIEDIATSQPVGMAELFNFSALHNRAEFGTYVAPEHRGGSIASRALRLVIEYARDYLNMSQLYCIVEAGNARSEHMLSRAGFVPTGLLKSWFRRECGSHDAQVWQRVFGEQDNDN